MAISVNRVTLVGRVGQDPEEKGKDGSFVTLSVATSRSWRDKRTGEKEERTEWHRVVLFNEQAAKFAKQYIRKGDLVCVEGRLETRKWEKSPGEVVYFTEVIVAPFDGSIQAMSKDAASGGGSERRERSESKDDSRDSSRDGSSGDDFGRGSYSNTLDDEIPF